MAMFQRMTIIKSIIDEMAQMNLIEMSTGQYLQLRKNFLYNIIAKTLTMHPPTPVTVT